MLLAFSLPSLENLDTARNNPYSNEQNWVKPWTSDRTRQNIPFPGCSNPAPPLKLKARVHWQSFFWQKIRRQGQICKLFCNRGWNLWKFWIISSSLLGIHLLVIVNFGTQKFQKIFFNIVRLRFQNSSTSRRCLRLEHGSSCTF